MSRHGIEPLQELRITGYKVHVKFSCFGGMCAACWQVSGCSTQQMGLLFFPQIHSCVQPVVRRGCETCHFSVCHQVCGPPVLDLLQELCRWLRRYTLPHGDLMLSPSPLPLPQANFLGKSTERTAWLLMPRRQESTRPSKTKRCLFLQAIGFLAQKNRLENTPAH